MILIFIYGPPAAGKLTIANELADITGYRVFHNHAVLDILSPLFPYNDQRLSTIRRRLSRRIRLDIFGTAAKAGVNCITTFGAAGGEYFDFYRDVQKAVNEAGGEVIFIQLAPSKEAILERVEAESRVKNKINSKAYLTEWLKNNPTIYEKFPDVDHLTIDNSQLSPSEVARQIKTETDI